MTDHNQEPRVTEQVDLDKLEAMLNEATRWSAGPTARQKIESAIALIAQIRSARQAAPEAPTEPIYQIAVDHTCRTWRDVSRGEYDAHPSDWPRKKRILATPAATTASTCEHKYVRDEEHPRHECCQLCGDVRGEATTASASTELADEILKLSGKPNDAWGVQKQIGYEEGYFDARCDAAKLARAALAQQGAAQAAHAGAVDMRPGVEFAAKFIEKRAEQYLQDHADTEPGTGAIAWQYGEAGRDYYNTLAELADDLRAAIATSTNGEPKA